MSVDQQFSLCWDNFQKNMSLGLQTLLQNESLVDVTLAVEGRYIKAHKMILSVCSPYFEKLFEANPCKHPIVFMKDVSYTALNDLMQFMYFGVVQVSQDTLATFIKTAEALQIKGLTGEGNESDVNQTKSVESSVTNDRAESPVPTNTSLSSSKAHQQNNVTYKRSASQPAAKRLKLNPNISSAIPSAAGKVKQSDAVGAPIVATSRDDLTLKLELAESCIDVDDAPEVGDYAVEEIADDIDDFSMDPSTMQIKPGTSGDDANQGDLMYMVNQRGQMVLIFDDNIFHVNRRYENSTFWQCTEYRKHRCRCRCITTRGTIKRSKTAHNHPPNTQKIKDKTLTMKCVADPELM